MNEEPCPCCGPVTDGPLRLSWKHLCDPCANRVHRLMPCPHETEPDPDSKETPA